MYSVPEELEIESVSLPDHMIWFDLEQRDQFTFPVPMAKIYQFIEG
ncbi:Uncharacterised protein [Streptococcus pneumoniae]|nr:Uncharacterised protein [Streptococcus pneumoniae]